MEFDKLVIPYAGVAQLVELLICNQPVAGSNPVTSFDSKAYEIKNLWSFIFLIEGLRKGLRYILKDTAGNLSTLREDGMICPVERLARISSLRTSPTTISVIDLRLFTLSL